MINFLWLLFIASLALLPLPFGGNRAWAATSFAFLQGLLVIGLTLTAQRTPDLWSPNQPRRRLLTALILLGAVAIWAWLQSVAWTPAAWHHPMWRFTQKLIAPKAGAISIDPTLMPVTLARMLSYAVVFLVVYFLGRDNKRAQQLLAGLVGAATVYALYGMVIQATGSNMVLWFEKWQYQANLTSTFVNKNSYATYAGLGLLAALTLAWRRLKEMEAREKTRRPLHLVLLHEFTMRDAAYFAPIAVLLGSIILSASRAGFVSVVAGLIAYVLALALNRRAKTLTFTTTLVFGAFVLGGLLWVGGETLIGNLDSRQVAQDLPTRFNAYRLALEAIADRPLLGYGLGTFDSAFKLYRDSSVNVWFHHAHNDYLEMMMDLGIPAALMLWAAIVLMASCCAQGVLHRQRNAEFPVLGLAATALVAIHALMDFSLHIPAVSATYAALLGLGAAHSWSRHNNTKRTSTHTV